MSSVGVVAVYCCVTNIPQVYNVCKSKNLMSPSFWASSIWASSSSGLFWFSASQEVAVRLATWIVVIGRLTWGSVLTVVPSQRFAVAKASSGLPRLLAPGLSCSPGGLFQRATQDMPAVFPQDKWSERERRRENEQQMENAVAFIS